MTDLLDNQDEPLFDDNDFARELRRKASEEDAAGGVTRSTGKSGKAGLANFAHGSAGDIFRVNPFSIFIKEGFNLRDPDDPANHAHVMELAESIRLIGLRKPIEVYWDKKDKKNYVTDGHCRLRAVRHLIQTGQARIEFIPVTTAEGPQSEVDRMATVIISGDGKNPTVFEKATHIAKMRDLGGIALKEVADRVGKDVKIIQKWLEINAAVTPAIKRLIHAGKVSPSSAMDAIQHANHDPVAALKEIEKAIAISEAQGNGRALPKYIKEARTGRRPSTLKAQMREFFVDRKIVVHNDGEYVRLAMAAITFQKLEAMLGGFDDPNTVEGSNMFDGVDDGEPSDDAIGDATDDDTYFDVPEDAMN
jgi:ParB-like chromosome segregation protein Spo0J